MPVPEISKLPILRTVDISSSFSEDIFANYSDIGDVLKAESNWITIHGPLWVISGGV